MNRLRKLLTRLYMRRYRLPRDLPREAFARYPDRVALAAPRGELTYRLLADRTLSLGHALSQSGLAAGDSLFALVPDDWEQIELRLASFEYGFVLTTFHPSHNLDLIHRAVQEVQPGAFVIDPALGGTLTAILEQEFPDLVLIRTGRGGEYERMVEQTPPRQSTADFSADAPASLGFTSGTTGQPKGLFTSHRVITTSLKLTALNVSVQRGERDVFLLGIPLVGAGSGVVLPMLFSGATLVLPRRYEPDELVHQLQQHEVTRTFITPSTLIDLLDHPQADLSSLRNVIYGTAQTPLPKLQQAVRRWGPIFQQGYGMAEVLPPVSLLGMEDHIRQGEPAPPEILRSAGTVVPEVEVRVVDEDGRPLPPGEIGTIEIKSPTVFSGYWGRPDLTEEVMRDGWYRTGDFGRVTEDRRLYVLGRRADVIDRGGRRLFPIWVEQVAHQHPGVKEACLVQEEAAGSVVLVVSPRRGFPAGADASELVEQLRETLAKELDLWLLPDRIEVWPELPRSYLVKVLHREIRQGLMRQRARRGA